MGTTDTLLLLPEDLLLSLPAYLYDIKDFNNLRAACRLLHSILGDTSPRTILRLAIAASRILFSPAPHVLVAATARQVITWAALSSEHTAELRAALRQGKEGLLNLALRHAGLTLQRIRELHEMRFSTIDPIVRLIRELIGIRWPDAPHFWNGRVGDAVTLYADAPEVFFHLVIYGELFAPAFDASLNSESIPPSMDVDTRLEFLKYCLPDWSCFSCQGSAANIILADGRIDPRRAVDTVGPYAVFAPGRELSGRFTEADNQLGLGHLLASPGWDSMWTEVRAVAGGDFAEKWKQRLWWNMVLCQGLEGMSMITDGGMDAWKERLVAWRKKIEAMTDIPAKVRVGRQETYVFPDLKGDLNITESGYFLDE